MTYRALRFWLDPAFNGSTALVRLLLLLILVGSPIAAMAALVEDHNPNHYGRVQAIGPAGVTLVVGCSGNATKTIPLSQMETVDFSGPCSPPRMESRSSPITAACPGAHTMMFEILVGRQEPWVSFAVKSVVLQGTSVTLTLRDDKQIVGRLIS